MRTITTAIFIVLAAAWSSTASAQGAKPDDPNNWGKGAVDNAHSGSPGGTVSGYASSNARGFSSARHAPGEAASHPTPPSGVSVPVGN
jgi:hypothetical protein